MNARTLLPLAAVLFAILPLAPASALITTSSLDNFAASNEG
jgi:hypothetical protein